MPFRLAQIAPIQRQTAELPMTDGQALLVLAAFLAANGGLVQFAGGGVVVRGGVHHTECVQHAAGNKMFRTKKLQRIMQLYQGCVGLTCVMVNGPAVMRTGRSQDGIAVRTRRESLIQMLVRPRIVAMAHGNQGLACVSPTYKRS